MPILWGIDLGGTKIEGVVVDSTAPTRPKARLRVPTEQGFGYDHILRQIRLLIERLVQETGIQPTRVGFSTPGTLDPSTCSMKNCNTTCLNGQPLRVDLERALQVPCRLANDANCFALAESTYGAAQGARGVFGVILGTGVGGGLVFDGKVIGGHHGISGEWGHNVLDPDGPACYCGKRGCVETIISGPALEAFYTGQTGVTLPLADIAERAWTGCDSMAYLTIERLRTQFAKALAVVLNIFDPDVVVLGGGVSNVAALYPNIQSALRPYLFNTECRTSIVQNSLGDSAGVFGAAALAAVE
jgi:predicted NBD/HSP70 family sugar kinase